jgi:hypothetical protein
MMYLRLPCKSINELKNPILRIFPLSPIYSEFNVHGDVIKSRLISR